MDLKDLATAGLNNLKAGFALAVPASVELKRRIAESVLVHRVSVDIAKRFVIQEAATDDAGFANARVRLTGKTGDGL
jgi:hypothetical protein